LGLVNLQVKSFPILKSHSRLLLSTHEKLCFALNDLHGGEPHTSNLGLPILFIAPLDIIFDISSMHSLDSNIGPLSELNLLLFWNRIYLWFLYLVCTMAQSFEVDIHQVKIVGVYMETPTRLCAIHFCSNL
jgi:hypothetical protein